MSIGAEHVAPCIILLFRSLAPLCLVPVEVLKFIQFASFLEIVSDYLRITSADATVESRMHQAKDLKASPTSLKGKHGLVKKRRRAPGDSGAESSSEGSQMAGGLEHEDLGQYAP